MCGRYTLSTDLRALAEHFALAATLGELPAPPPRYNIPPSEAVPIVRTGESGERQLALARWGLIPGWTRDPRAGARMINARAESVADKPAFRAALRGRRCLIPADGFYEWKKSGGIKQPYWAGLPDHGLFAFAGLWERWRGPGGETLESCTIITTDANPQLAGIHDRMPVILAPDQYAQWLDPGEHSPGRLLPLLRPYPTGTLLVYPVSRRVNDVRNDDPELIARLADTAVE